MFKLAPIVILGMLLPTVSGGAMNTALASPGGELAAKLMEMWDTNDTSAVESVFAPDCVYEDTNGRIFEGREGAIRYINHIHAWADSVRVEPKSLISLGDAAVVEWQFSGRQVAPVGFVNEVTGREFSIRGVTVVESSGGLITRASDYVDIATFLMQLGVECSAVGEE